MLRAEVEVGVLALLDTGAAATALSARLARKLRERADVAGDPASVPAKEPAAPSPLRMRWNGCEIPIAESIEAAAVRSPLDERVSPRVGVEVSLLSAWTSSRAATGWSSTTSTSSS